MKAERTINTSIDFEPGFEPERYELDAPPAYQFDSSRRDFIKSIGGGLIVVLLAKPSLAQEARSGRRRSGSGRNAAPDLEARLHIDERGQITVYTGKVEVGQNIRTSLTQAVAEELRAPVNSIRLVMADTQLTPDDGGTSGSRTTPDTFQQLRRVAAAAREILIELAAATWNVEAASLTAVDGKIIQRGTERSIGYGALMKDRKLTKTVAPSPSVTPADQWKVAGHSLPKVNGNVMVTGRHRFASDIRLEGGLHARVLRPAALGATLTSIDAKDAETMPNVTVVRDGDFVGVAAPTEWEADRALRVIKAQWRTRDQISHKELFAHLKQNSGSGGRGGGATRIGSIQAGLEAADLRLKETYTVAYIAHTPLEPRAAVAQWENGKLTVWTGTQQPLRVRNELANAFQLSSDLVRVIVPDTGSGYGGKHSGEAALEAARLAKAAGKPVKLVWTREEEFTWAYFRPAGVIEISSGARKDGILTAWEFHNYNSGASAIRPWYEIPNQLIEFHSTQSPLRQGSYRALASTANVFARETHIDELAHAARLDPLEFRLKNLRDARLRAVFKAAAERFGWGKTQPRRGRGFGIGGGSEKGSYAATCAEIEVNPEDGRVRVVRAVSAFECGAIVNPDHLKNQVEGALIMGIGGALFEAVEFDNGKILNPRLSRYRVPRFSDAPEMEVVLLDRQDLPSAGAGETPIVGIAPAIGNAIFAATGIRLRSLPLAPSGVKL